MEWLVANWVGLLAAAGAVVIAFSMIAKLTPWESDDKVADFLIKIVNFLSLNKAPPK